MLVGVGARPSRGALLLMSDVEGQEAERRSCHQRALFSLPLCWLCPIHPSVLTFSLTSLCADFVPYIPLCWLSPFYTPLVPSTMAWACSAAGHCSPWAHALALCIPTLCSHQAPTQRAHPHLVLPPGTSSRPVHPQSLSCLLQTNPPEPPCHTPWQAARLLL